MIRGAAALLCLGFLLSPDPAPAQEAGAPVQVASDSVVQLELRLRAEDRVADCLEAADCAEVLRPDRRLTAHLAEADRLREVALRTALALAGGTRRFREGWVACLSDTTAAAPVVRARFPWVVPDAECAPGPGVWDLLHRPTGARAFSFAVDRLERDGERAVAGVSFGLQGWICHFERVQGEWVPRTCRMDWIA